MRKCKCGNDVASNARACPKCGHRFTGAFTKLVAWIFVGFLGLMILAGVLTDTPGAAPSSTPASSAAAQATPEISPSSTTSDAYSYASAIELCKAETLKRQPNAKGYVATGHWFPARPNQFHIQVDFGLGGPLAVMTSDCRIARKNDKLALTKINFIFAN